MYFWKIMKIGTSNQPSNLIQFIRMNSKKKMWIGISFQKGNQNWNQNLLI
jgi:hypothetical protein